MKKILIIPLALLLLSSCGSNNDNTANDEVQPTQTIQATEAPTPRSLDVRNDELDKLQEEYAKMEEEYNSIPELNDRKRELLQQMTDNITEQMSVAAGNEGEENMFDLVK